MAHAHWNHNNQTMGAGVKSTCFYSYEFTLIYGINELTIYWIYEFTIYGIGILVYSFSA